MATADEQDGTLIDRLKVRVQEKVQVVEEAGVARLREATALLDEIIPLIGELGYTVNAVDVGIGLVPDIAIEVGGMAKKMDEAAYQRVLEERKNNRVVCAMVTALQAASGLHGRIQVMGMASDTATLTLGVPPKVSLHFRKSP